MANGKGDRLISFPRGANIGLGIDWSFPNMDGLINNRGEQVLHETGMRCPCGLEDTFAGQVEVTNVPRRRTTIGCSLCGGSGLLFRNPRKVIALIASIREEKQRLEAGWAQSGDCVMSPRPGYEVSAGDQITFMWGQPVADGQTIMRGAANMDDNKSRDTGLDEDEDMLWYHATSSIWCEDTTGKVYKEGDFKLDGSRIIKWSENAPHKGESYVIKYNAHLAWLAFVPPEFRRDRDRDLGSRVVLRKRHVALINESPASSGDCRVAFCSRISGC